MRTQTHSYGSTLNMLQVVAEMEDAGWAVRSMQPTSWSHSEHGSQFTQDWVVVYEIVKPT